MEQIHSAELASIAYNEPKEVKKQARKLGFTTVEYYDNDGAQAYRFQNKTDLVIACRGTQPTEYQDLGADMRAWPVVSETISRVHKGFKKEVDDLWPMICEDIDRTVKPAEACRTYALSIIPSCSDEDEQHDVSNDHLILLDPAGCIQRPLNPAESGRMYPKTI